MTFDPATLSDEQLAAQCELQTYRSSGPGGQNVNRRETAVRLRHLPTGITVTAQEARSQWLNRQIALERLRERLVEREQRRRPRVATKIPYSARRRIMARKLHQGEKKQLRRKPSSDGE